MQVAHFLIDGLVYRNPLFQGLQPTQLAMLTAVLKPVSTPSSQLLWVTALFAGVF
jgi:hypothetical protein